MFIQSIFFISIHIHWIVKNESVLTKNVGIKQSIQICEVSQYMDSVVGAALERRPTYAANVMLNYTPQRIQPHSAVKTNVLCIIELCASTTNIK